MDFDIGWKLEAEPFTLHAFSGWSQNQKLMDLDVWGVKKGVLWGRESFLGGPRSLRSKEDDFLAVFWAI